ncbi:DNA (cytosine-5-)-methyltransferase [Paenibacillus sp. KR2-11]|uniref:DNA (cytosine-5-)-methyltransferase n=1 Tax=Paenibacillus sp. KR2-11 TaxID=3385500 RepID=UPI0038FC125B
MKLTYDKLWYRLAEKGWKKQDLREIAGISRTSIAKLSKDENVTTDVLMKICSALECDISDIVNVKKEDSSINLQSNISNKETYKINSFFAGIGGFDIAFERHGFATQFLCEVNPFCNEVLATHWPNVMREQDINNIVPESIPTADVWCGGFPCQDVSVARGASQRLGLSGTQSGLFHKYASLLEKHKPQVVIIENVEGLFNSNDGRDFGVVIQKMLSMGYAVAWRVLNSRYFGVPQSRPRVYLCCWMKNPVKATAAMFDRMGAFKPQAAREDFLTEASKPNEYPKVPNVAYCLAATSGRHTGTDWSRTYVVCRDGVRRLTPKEYERLQGFPDMWTLPNAAKNDDSTDTLRYTALGNAVSVPVVEWVADRVYSQLSISDSNDTVFSRDSLKSMVPEFKKSIWSQINMSQIDFSDETKTYKWPKAGLAWENEYIGGSVQPTPVQIINSSLVDLVEKDFVGKRYYLTPNAAEGILRRVDSQGRKLFAPLRKGLEIEREKNMQGVTANANA